MKVLLNHTHPGSVGALLTTGNEAVDRVVTREPFIWADLKVGAYNGG